MKIGLLTFHRSTNFGSLLQTFGLYKKITDLGYDCELIDYRCEAIEKAEYLNVKINITKPREVLKQILFQPKLNEKAKSFFEFSRTHMEQSPKCDRSNIGIMEERYDKIIVGSDIVWGRDITHDDYTYFLDFVKDNTKKYAFASSVGYCVVRNDESKLCLLLRSFQKIAVREKDAVAWVKKISGVKASWVCDPTMLLTISEWKKVIQPTVMRKGYVLVYFNSPDNKCLNDAITYAKANKKRVFLINYGLPKKNTVRQRPTSLNEFLGLINNADMVFTASYHGMLFSIYFEKQFLFYTRAHKSRVLSLADRIGLSDYCGDLKDVLTYIPIDYTKVQKKVDSFRVESINILKGMLDDA